MKIKVLYDTDIIINGHANYTTIEVPDDDYTVLIDIDYEQRLIQAKPEKRREVKRFETLQDVFDAMNRQEYNAHRRFNRKRGEMKTQFRKDDLYEDDTNPMEYIPENSQEEERNSNYEYENVCQQIRQALGKKKEWADMFIAVRIDGVSIREYETLIGTDENNISQKLKRAEKKLREFFENRQI